MNDEIFSDIEIEQAALRNFRQHIEIDSVIMREASVGGSTRATVFMSDRRRLYAYIESESGLLLADVKKIVSRMNLVAAEYLPPNDQAGYFDEIGKKEFIRVFPSRRPVSPGDIAYYRTLAPYSPALIEIARVKNGSVHAYDTTLNKWVPTAAFSYSKIHAHSM